MLIDAERGIRGDADAILERLKDVRQPMVLILNKVDRVKHEALLALTAAANESVPFKRTFMVSALTGSGCKDLLDYLAETLPAGPWYYPEDQISDLPMRQLAAEITREKLYLRLHQELPYSSHIETEKWEEKPDGSVRIDQTIYVERDSQKKIVLGHKGETIRAIGQAARMEIAGILEQKVHLFLFVKVRENWGDDPERYREMGLEFPHPRGKLIISYRHRPSGWSAEFPRWKDLVDRLIGRLGQQDLSSRRRDAVRFERCRLFAAIEKEHRWCQTLAPLLPLPIPVPLAMGIPCGRHSHTRISILS